MQTSEYPIRYFLGANTARGFYSLYDGFTDPAAGDFLWYIKGGPGNGKSTFMRRVAQAAEKAGKTVEYFPCSGDPSSLDGIYIREDSLAYVDATSPHVQEPVLPGAAGRYLDLSEFYRPGLGEKREEIERLFRLYRGEYTRCYELLRSAELCAPERTTQLVSPAVRRSVERRAEETAGRLLAPGAGYSARRRFLSAYTCQGPVFFWETAAAAGRVCTLDNALGLVDSFLQTVHALCRERGCPVILCPDPLSPEKLEAVLLPEQELAFVAVRRERPYPGAAWRHLRLDAMAGSHTLQSRRSEYRSCRVLTSGILQQARSALESAKRFHDELEAVYHPYVDFEAVESLCRKHILAVSQ